MTAPASPARSIRPTTAPQPPMDLQQFRRAAYDIVEARDKAVDDYENQIDIGAAKESEYQRRKMTKITRLKAEGKSATEAIEVAKGDDWVCEAQVNRDIAVDMKKAKLERINGLDAERASLHRIAEWSMQMEKFA